MVQQLYPCRLEGAVLGGRLGQGLPLPAHQDKEAPISRVQVGIPSRIEVLDIVLAQFLTLLAAHVRHHQHDQFPGLVVDGAQLAYGAGLQPRLGFGQEQMTLWTDAEVSVGLVLAPSRGVYAFLGYG
ncbi:hypothetical protein [Hymenobacter jeollabukensis]|uniref:hypothetical protein n=1 Tax=Hymenobacter jeollabukensis TaxID=2025313 RepID=UPI00148527C6|nr:hypothetical protein [Hymenobacter jeollabukensis]